MIAYVESSENATCFSECDGSTTLIIQGGTPPYYINSFPLHPEDEIITEMTIIEGICAGAEVYRIRDSNNCTSAATTLIEAYTPDDVALSDLEVAFTCIENVQSLNYSFHYASNLIGETFELWVDGQLVDQQIIEAGQTEWSSVVSLEEGVNSYGAGVRLSSSDSCDFSYDFFETIVCCVEPTEIEHEITSWCYGGKAYVKVEFNGTLDSSDAFFLNVGGQNIFAHSGAPSPVVQLPTGGAWTVTVSHIENAHCAISTEIEIVDCLAICWDQNGNETCDPGEDYNGDGLCNEYDCDRLFCLDSNKNGECDPEEDYNGDGICNQHDCDVLFPNDEIGVWPGDTNLDGIANNMDLVNIGLGFNQNGPARAEQNIAWYEHAAENWENNTVFFANTKHADCNGNGNIDLSDVEAIVQNYGSIHGKTEGEEGTEGAAPIFVEFPEGSLEPGQSLSLPLMYGTEDTPVANAYGLAITVDYSNAFLVAASLNFDNSWIGELGTDAISLVKHFPEEKRFEVAFTRITQTSTAGFGQIGTIQGTLPENLQELVDLNSELSISIANVSVVNENAEEEPFDVMEVPGTVTFSQEDFASELLVYPTIVHTQLNIVNQESENLSYLNIIDIKGKVVYTEKLSNQTSYKIRLPEMSSGIYFLELGNEAFRDVRKIQVAQ